MSTAIPELIALELITRLEQITTGNGYVVSVPSVDRVDRDGNAGDGSAWSPRNLAIGVAQLPTTRNKQLDHAGNPPAVGYTVAFNIHAFVRQSETSTTADATTENTMEASIKKAVAENSTSWHQFDGNAINADWGTTVPFTSATGDHAGVTVPLLVHYRISELDPYTVRA